MSRILTKPVPCRTPGRLLLTCFFWLSLLTGSTLTFTDSSIAEKPSILQVEAYPGDPFGVGKVTFRLGQAGKLVQNTGAVHLSDSENRVFYPAFTDGLLRRMFDRPAVGGMQTVWFLFRGDEPLELTIRGADSTTFPVEMSRRRPALQRLAFQGWWRQYNAQARKGRTEGDYPPLVETYLISMLSRRLGLNPPMLERLSSRRMDELQKTFSLIFDVESIRAESIRQLMTQPPRADLATLTLPEHPEWNSPPQPSAPAETTIEPIARFVPAECFYLRFGNWNNQLWLKRLMEEYGGDLSRMISLRGHRGGDTQKMLDQLVLESSQVDDWFGGNLIEDVAAIGTDLYVDDGPSNAILLLAKNGSLEGQIRSRRKKYARENANQGVTLTEVEIGGHPVSFLSTPDNRVRSFYATTDLCHITSSSRTIVKRFFEAAEGRGSLADYPEFQMTRQIMPVEREDTVFIYLSRAFFENLLNPQYQIELSRRNRSLANIQLLQMAQWAAHNEGYRDDNIEQMMAHGFLPENFNQLPDGSSSEFRDGAWHDSMRGRRGYYLPIADVQIDRITPAESAWLEERIKFFENELQEVDPLVVAFKRYARDDQVERVVIDARVAPFGKQKYGWLGNILGPPLEFEVAMGPETLISFQASIAGNMLTPEDTPHQIFASVQGDVPPKTDLRPTNFFEVMELLRTTPGFIGSWPKAGYLDILPALGAEPDAEGYTYSRILGVWRLQHGDYSLISFDRQRLEAARDQLAIVPAEEPAQVRIRVGDLANSNLRDWANVMYFERSWETSIANVMLLNLMIQQFNLPPEAALPLAEQLLGVELVCSLGGEYQLTETESGSMSWMSTAWPSFEQPNVPADYEAPPMKWFRGMSLDVYQLNTQFVVHGHLDIARDPENFGSGAGDILGNLPSFDMFKGFSQPEELPPGQEKPDNDQGKLRAPKDRNPLP